MPTQRIKNKNGEWVLVNNGGGGSTSDIIVDSELSSESTNPIQNKAVAESLKNRPELLEIRYYFGEKELTEEDKAINAASFNTYVTNIINNTKNLYKFFIQNEYLLRTESSAEMSSQDSEGNPILYIIFGDLYGIANVTNGTKLLPYTIAIDSTGNIIEEVEMDGPYNAGFSIGEDSGDFLEWVRKAGVLNPNVSMTRSVTVSKKYKVNGNTGFLYGVTITPIINLPDNGGFIFSCIFEDGYVHTIKLDETTGYLVEDEIIDPTTSNKEIVELGNSIEEDIAILNKYSELGCPSLLVKNGGGSTFGYYGYTNTSPKVYNYTYLGLDGNVYKVEFTEEDTSYNTQIINSDRIYLIEDIEEGNTYALLNKMHLTNDNSAINIIPTPTSCYKLHMVAGTPSFATVSPLRSELHVKTVDGNNIFYTKCTILGDDFNTLEVWEIDHATGVPTLVSTTPFTDILGLNTNE